MAEIVVVYCQRESQMHRGTEHSPPRELPLSCPFREVMRILAPFGSFVAINPHADRSAAFSNPHKWREGRIWALQHWTESTRFTKKKLLGQALHGRRSHTLGLNSQTKMLGALKAMQTAKTSLAMPFSATPEHPSRQTQPSQTADSNLLTPKSPPKHTSANTKAPKPPTPRNSLKHTTPKRKPSRKSDFQNDCVASNPTSVMTTSLLPHGMTRKKRLAIQSNATFPQPALHSALGPKPDQSNARPTATPPKRAQNRRIRVPKRTKARKSNERSVHCLPPRHHLLTTIHQSFTGQQHFTACQFFRFTPMHMRALTSSISGSG